MCVCVSVCMCVCLVQPGQEIVDLAVPGPCLFRVQRPRGVAVESVVRKSGVCKSYVSFFRVLPTACSCAWQKQCILLRYTKKHGA